MLEKQIEAYLVKRVRELGGRAWKFTSPAQRGVADRLVVMPGGQVWFVEAKTLGGRLSPLQREFMDECKRLGANYRIVWEKADVDAFIESVSGV